MVGRDRSQSPTYLCPRHSTTMAISLDEVDVTHLRWRTIPLEGHATQSLGIVSPRVHTAASLFTLAHAPALALATVSS